MGFITISSIVFTWWVTEVTPSDAVDTENSRCLLILSFLDLVDSMILGDPAVVGLRMNHLQIFSSYFPKLSMLCWIQSS